MVARTFLLGRVFLLVAAFFLNAVSFGFAAAADLPGLAQAAVVQIDNRGFGGGSGTYLGDGYVVTCDHLFRDSRSGQSEVGRIVVSFPTGHGSTAKLVGQHRVWDVALLKLDAPPADVAGVPLAPDFPRPGTTVVSCGYGRQGELLASVGRVTGYGRDKYLATSLSDTMLLTGAARSGDSGGPILDLEGRLVGVLWGSDGQTVVGTQVGQCREILRQWQCPPASGPSVVSPGRVSPGQAPPARRPIITVPQQPPIQPASPAIPSQNELVRLREELTQLRRQIAAIQAKPGPPGPAGPPGERGPQGPPGTTHDIDLPKLADAVRKQIAGSLRIKVEPMQPPRP